MTKPDDSLAAEQHAAQIEAGEHGELLALARRAAGAGTWDLDIRKGEVRYCPRSLEILGHPPDRSPLLTAAEWATHIFPGDADRVLAEGLQARRDRTDFITEYRIVRPDGEIRWVRGMGRTLLDEDGDAIRCVGFNFDITEERKAEEQMRALQARLIEATRAHAMRTMGEKLAHELNQPLAAASNYLAGARAALDDPEGARATRVAQAFDGASAAVHRAAEVVRDLRALVRRPGNEAQSTDLGAAIRTAVELALAGADERGVHSVVEIEPGLETPTDELQVQQVLINLLRNALEAMDGCATKKMSISCRRQGEQAVVRIRDSGAGIDEAGRAGLFEPFVTTKPYSMGIGLAISRTIVEANGGALWAEHPETGTVFSFTLPLAAQAGTPPQAGKGSFGKAESGEDRAAA